MLRRRGISAVLLAGVKSLENSSLHAHAWIRASDGVVDWNSDGSDSSSFAVVLRVGHRVVAGFASQRCLILEH